VHIASKNPFAKCVPYFTFSGKLGRISILRNLYWQVPKFANNANS